MGESIGLFRIIRARLKTKQKKKKPNPSHSYKCAKPFLRVRVIADAAERAQTKKETIK